MQNDATNAPSLGAFTWDEIARYRDKVDELREKKARFAEPMQSPVDCVSFVVAEFADDYDIKRIHRSGARR